MSERDDADVDVCLRCGRYYGYTPALESVWRNGRLHRDGEVMPQFCFNCMSAEYEQPLSVQDWMGDPGDPEY